MSGSEGDVLWMVGLLAVLAAGLAAALFAATRATSSARRTLPTSRRSD